MSDAPQPIESVARRRAFVRELAAYAVLVVAALLAAGSWLEPRFFMGAWLGFFLLALLTLRQEPEAAFRRAAFFGTLALSVAFHWVPGVLTNTLGLSYVNCCLLFLLMMAWD